MRNLSESLVLNQSQEPQENEKEDEATFQFRRNYLRKKTVKINNHSIYEVLLKDAMEKESTESLPK